MRKGLRVGIAGPGLIGGSIALRARALGARILAWDPGAENLRNAVALGIVEEALPQFEDLADASDVLVLSGPVDATLAQLETLSSRESSQAELVIDVASVKARVAIAGAGVSHFVGTHPIAGSDRSGCAAARADLFAGKVWTIDASAAEGDREAAEAFVRDMGARPFEIDATAHDRSIALTSHLPQVLSVALGAQLERSSAEFGVSELCGTGMASMLRLGASAWRVWQPVLEANAGSLAQEVRELAAILLDAASALETGRTAGLEREFRAAAQAVARLEANGLPVSRVEVP